MKKAFIIALLVAININSAVCCAEELIELVGVYEFSDGHSAVLLKNNSKETVCIEINIDIRDENGEDMILSRLDKTKIAEYWC